ncbi:MAG: hypothetical protein QOG72_40 [Sphingomonadales bacterium]|jgi:hypothetical protein|nr:hypothetical protein [Sphingomonadales bacterium]
MFERLIRRGEALAEQAARRRRDDLAEALREEAPAGVEVSEEGDGVVLGGRDLVRRFALDPALRWLVAGRRR